MLIFPCKLELHRKASRSVVRERVVVQCVRCRAIGGWRRVFATDHRSAEAGTRGAHSPCSRPCQTMFPCRRSVSGVCVFLRRLNFSGTGGATCSLRHYRAIVCWRVYRSAAAASPGARSPRLGHESPLGSGRKAAFALNATRYSDARSPVICPAELESRLSVRSPAAMQTRRASTTPESTRDQRAAQTDQVSPVSSAEGQGSDGKLSKTQQLRTVFKEYGAVGVCFHIGISLISLGIFYLAVSSGLDVAALLCRLGFSESVVQSRLAAGTSTFVLAYAMHKLFAPLRISITLVSVPLIVRHLRRTGLFKPRTSGQR